MRVCILSNLYPPWVIGGAELSAHALAKDLAGGGHRVSVITLADRSGTADEDGVRVHRLRSAPFYSVYHAKQRPGWMKPAWHLVDAWNPLMLARVREALREERPDVLHCHNIAGFSASVWEAARAEGVPVVQHLHDYHLVCLKATLTDESLAPCPPFHLPCRLRAAHHFRQLGGKVGHVISPSRFCADKVFSFAREPMPWKVSIVPNGTPFSEVPPVAGDWDAPRLRVLFIGGLFEHKGFPILADLIARVNAAGEGDAYEFHIGGKGPLEPLARSLAETHANVRFHGFVGGDLKLSLFREAHVFFFPSVWMENNPVSVTEALAIGLPVLGAQVGGVPELLAPVSPGLLFPPRSVEAALAALRGFAADRGRLREVSAALLRDRSRYGLAAQTARTLEVYRAAAAGVRGE